MTDTLFSVRTPSGRMMKLRKLPKHFFLYYGELPAFFSEKVVNSIEKNGDLSETELLKQLSPSEIKQTLIFMREAVNFVCVEPKISLTPKDDSEISPFAISEEDFNFLTVWAMKSAGGSAGLESFRTESAKTADDRSGGAKLRKTAKRTTRNKR